MVIQHNMSALFANRSLGQIAGYQQKSTEKLSSGYKINRAADDAAGLSISEKMRKQIRGLTRASDNIQDGVSLCQVADGAMAETQDMMHRMTELCVQAANGTLSPEDRSAINREIAQIKMEMQRIFHTTDFNSQPIWNRPADSKVEIPGSTQRAIINPGYQYFQVNDTNLGKLPSDNTYRVSANASDVTVNWTGKDGNPYSITKTFSDFKQEPSFAFADTGNTFRFTISPDATDQEIITAIDGERFSTSNSIAIGLQSSNSDISFSSITLSLDAAYRSQTNGSTNPMSLDNYSHDTLVPSLTGATNITANADVPSWTFKFNLDGIGEVTATSNSTMDYQSSSYVGPENLWWYRSNGYQYSKHYFVPATPQGFADAVTGSVADNRPGLLTDNSMGGVMHIGFSLTDSTGTNIGNFAMYANYHNGESADDYKSRITSALSSGDFVATPTSLSTSSLRQSQSPYYTDYTIPQYDKVIGLEIQSGYKSDDQILLQYKSLSLASLGIEELNTETREAALEGLGAISSALDKLSEQRSLFGAYQNRLEHAIDNVDNTVENVTAAESRIRDTDMAKEMANLMSKNVIAQAGQSILAQAKQAPESVLNLLQ